MNDYEQFWRDNSGMEDKSSYWELPDDTVKAIKARDQAIVKWGFAVPSDKAINICRRYSPIIEIGAGLGYWAKLIGEAGGVVEAYDDYSWFKSSLRRNMAFAKKNRHHTVMKGGPEIAAQFPNHTLMLCWPCYATSMAADALAAYEGSRVIYIGEGYGGCTADDAFHDRLEAEWEEVEGCELPQWWGIHDCLTVYRRAS